MTEIINTCVSVFLTVIEDNTYGSSTMKTI